MIRSEIGSFGETHESRVTHQVSDAAMQVGSGVVDVFPVFDANQIRNLGGVIQTAIPPSHAAAAAGYGAVERKILSLRQSLHPLIDVVFSPRNSIRLV